MNLYGTKLMRWREALANFQGQTHLFSNNFTRQRGLEPTGLLRQVTAVHRTQHGVTTHLCGPMGSAWSPVSVADAIRQIEAGVARYFTQFENSVAFLEVVDDRFLRTKPDAVPGNNLDKLPLCEV